MINKAQAKRPFRVRNVSRWFKLKYLQLTRAEGGPSIVAMGFSIGLAIEMFTLPTAGLAFFLIFPLVYLLRANTAAALIGFVFGKIIYIPMSFLNRRVGGMVLPHDIRAHLMEYLPEWLNTFIRFNLKLIVGGMINGLILGIVLYFPVQWALRWYDRKRKERKHQRKAQRLLSSKTWPHK